nr:hypothetical protein [Alkaliphilus peptidifermentans]
MASTVNPYFSNSSSGFPDSPNVSAVPILFRGTGQFSEITSATAEPKPPIMLCSSTVTILPVSLAALIISSHKWVLLYVC